MDTKKLVMGISGIVVVVGAVAKKPLQELGLDLSTETLIGAAGGIGALAQLFGGSEKKDTDTGNDPGNDTGKGETDAD